MDGSKEVLPRSGVIAAREEEIFASPPSIICTEEGAVIVDNWNDNGQDLADGIFSVARSGTKSVSGTERKQVVVKAVKEAKNRNLEARYMKE